MFISAKTRRGRSPCLPSLRTETLGWYVNRAGTETCPYAPRLKRTFLAIALSVLLILTLAGCGDAGGNGDLITLHITPAATRTSAPPILPTLAPTTYKVKPGDTLSGIAAMFGITTDELIRANSISDPDRVGEGLELTIPARSQNTSDKETIGAPSASPTPALPPPDVTPPMGP